MELPPGGCLPLGSSFPWWLCDLAVTSITSVTSVITVMREEGT